MVPYDFLPRMNTLLTITGTTAKEAMFTISGSAAATSAAWQNVLTAIGGGGDLKEAMCLALDRISLIRAKYEAKT